MADTRLTPDLDLDGISPDEAFGVLGNEIRLDIIRVLWHADAAREYEDGSDAATAISFSDLRHRVDVDDNGKFNYHLSKLTPYFVRQTEDGYRLSGAGKQIARTVIAVSGPEFVDFSADVDGACPLCGSSMTATYEDQWLRVTCTECDGLFGDEAPKGTLFLAQYPAAGFADRGPEEALATGLYQCVLDLTYMMHGVCRECAGRISGTVSVCDDHASRGGDACDACGTPFAVWAEQRCDTCGFAKRLPVELFTIGLTSVIGFLEEQGVDILAPSFDQAFEHLRSRTDTAVTEDPFRVSVTIEGDAESLTVSLDDSMNVVDLARRPLPE